MTKFANFKIKHKIIIPYTLLIISIITGLFSWYMFYEKKRNEKELLNKVSLLVEGLSESCSQPLAAREYNRLQELFVHLQKVDKDIVYISLLSNKGKQVASTENSPKKFSQFPTSSATKLTNEVSYQEIKKNEVDYELWCPVKLFNVVMGNLRVGISKRRINQAINNSIVVSLSIAIIVLIFGVILFMLIIDFVVIKPMRNLAQALNKISTGDLAEEVHCQSSDEIGEFSVAFDKMRLDLKKMTDDLNNSNRKLAEMVDERTKELSITIENLKNAQNQLIESEKMAALGQLIAGIAHEMNTPMGAIRSSVGNINHTLSQTLEKLPLFFRTLSLKHFDNFTSMLSRSLTKNMNVTAKEERKCKRKLRRQLEENEVDESETIADILVEMGIYQEIDQYLEFFKEDRNTEILQIAYKLSGLLRSSRTINTATDRASKVIFALKSYAYSGEVGEMVETNLIDNIETILTLYENQLKRGIEVIKNYQEIPEIMCFPDELNQIWTNLIHNAIQAMDNSGTLTIDISLSHEDVIIAVSDNGQGIKAEVKEKIFTAFFTTKPRGEGSGLGLSIVKKIVEKHNGKIEVDNKIGKTTFRVFIPIKSDDSQL